jgi:hypothetical protein
VSFSDHLLSVVRPSVNFYIFNIFSITTGIILTGLSRNHPWGKGVQFYSNEGEHTCPRGDNSKNTSNSSPEPADQFQSNLVQTILGRRKVKFDDIKDQVLFKGEVITNLQVLNYLIRCKYNIENI